MHHVGKQNYIGSMFFRDGYVTSKVLYLRKAVQRRGRIKLKQIFQKVILLTEQEQSGIERTQGCVCLVTTIFVLCKDVFTVYTLKSSSA